MYKVELNILQTLRSNFTWTTSNGGHLVHLTPPPDTPVSCPCYFVFILTVKIQGILFMHREELGRLFLCYTNVEKKVCCRAMCVCVHMCVCTCVCVHVCVCTRVCLEVEKFRILTKLSSGIISEEQAGG